MRMIRANRFARIALRIARATKFSTLLWCRCPIFPVKRGRFQTLFSRGPEVFWRARCSVQSPHPYVGPDVMPSGFGVNLLFWSGEFMENCRRISQRILMANFDSEFFGLVFPGFQATEKIHAQNSRPELSAFLSNFTFLNPKFIHGDFLLTGEANHTICTPSCRCPISEVLG